MTVVRSDEAVDMTTAATVWDYLERWATSDPDRVQYTFVEWAAAGADRHSLTRADTARRAKALGARLMQVVDPGERVAVLVPQGLDYVTGFLGRSEEHTSELQSPCNL